MAKKSKTIRDYVHFFTCLEQPNVIAFVAIAFEVSTRKRGQEVVLWICVR